MSDEELLRANERLANPPEIDFALSRVLGLYVVGRLAQRHGIRVQLRHSWYGGVTALTLLPHALVDWTERPQVMPEGAAATPAAQLPPPQRPTAPATPGPVDSAPSPEPTSANHLPIFEAARSDWFTAEPVQHARPLRPDDVHVYEDDAVDDRDRAAAASGAGYDDAWPPPQPGPAAGAAPSPAQPPLAAGGATPPPAGDRPAPPLP